MYLLIYLLAVPVTLFKGGSGWLTIKSAKYETKNRLPQHYPNTLKTPPTPPIPISLPLSQMSTLCTKRAVQPPVVQAEGNTAYKQARYIVICKLKNP